MGAPAFGVIVMVRYSGKEAAPAVSPHLFFLRHVSFSSLVADDYLYLQMTTFSIYLTFTGFLRRSAFGRLLPFADGVVTANEACSVERQQTTQNGPRRIAYIRRQETFLSMLWRDPRNCRYRRKRH